MGNANGVLIPVRDVLASEHKLGRVEMIEAQINAFLGTDRKGQFFKQQVAAIGIGFIKVRLSLKRLNISASMPWRNKRSRGLLPKNCGVNDKGRLAKPRPLRIIPATASPGVITACASGTRRVSIMFISPKCCGLIETDTLIRVIK